MAPNKTLRDYVGVLTLITAFQIAFMSKSNSLYVVYVTSHLEYVVSSLRRKWCLTDASTWAPLSVTDSAQIPYQMPFFH